VSAHVVMLRERVTDPAELALYAGSAGRPGPATR